MNDNNSQSLSHTVWECKYHVVWIPKYRKKVLYGKLREHLGALFKDLASQKESEVIEGHLLPDHVHMLISIPPKYAVSQVVGFLKGKSAIQIARVYMGRERILRGNIFGPEGIMFPPWGWMKRPFGHISRARKRKIDDWIN